MMKESHGSMQRSKETLYKEDIRDYSSDLKQELVQGLHEMGLTKRSASVYMDAPDDREFKGPEIYRMSGLNHRTAIYVVLNDLVDKGFLEKAGNRHNRKWKKVPLPEAIDNYIERTMSDYMQKADDFRMTFLKDSLNSLENIEITD